MQGNSVPGAARPAVAATLLVLVLVVQPGWIRSADAARPPEGRTYFTTLIGVDEPFAIRHECFEFTGAEVCSLQGGLCGTWQRTGPRAAATSFSFQLSFLDNGLPVTLDGHGRIDSAGSKSSLGGAGFQQEDGTRFNFSFIGREASRERCLDLLADDQTVPGSGNQATESRDVSGFASVSLAGVGRLIIEYAGNESLTITADDNILPLLTSEVVDGQLRLASTGPFSTRHPIIYRLTVLELDEILVSGAASVESFDVDTRQLRVTLAGASVAELAGAVDRQVVGLSGACVYQAADLDSRVATVDLVGASLAVVRVRELLEGTVAGLSTLEYYGSPQVNVAVSGLGTVRRLGN